MNKYAKLHYRNTPLMGKVVDIAIIYIQKPRVDNLKQIKSTNDDIDKISGRLG